MTDPNDEAIVAHILRSDSPPAESGPCLDDNVLVGWAEGRLDAARRARVEEHLSVCDACRGLATDLAEGLAESATATASPGDAGSASLLSLPAARRRRGGALALAAAVLVALTAGVAALWPRTDPLDVDGALVAAADRLRASSPGLLDGFVPASRSERLASRGDATRATLAVLRPAATLLDARPRIEWSDATAGAAPYDVVVAGPDGAELWKRRTAALSLEFPDDVPALAPGNSYVVEVAAVGGARATRGFRVASAAEGAAWARTVAEAERLVDAPVRDLLLAHVAARRELLLEAHARIDAHLARGAEPVGEETRGWVRRLLDWKAGPAPRAGDGGG